MLSIIIFIFVYFFINSVISFVHNPQVNIDIDYGENDTLILFYNLTTNYTYFITIRSFGNEQLKLGLFLPSNKFVEHSLEVFYQQSTTELFDLFIICFHFILQINDLDIQCKDIRLLKNKSQISQDFLPSYNPLFVPMMYALSVIMLLPVIIQHHRHKQALLLQRKKELRRLSVSISQDKRNPKQNFMRKILSQIIENGNINYANLPLDIELVSLPSTKTILDDVDENANVTFTLQNLQPFIHKYDDDELNEQSVVDAHDCVAHLLDNTPWNTPHIDQPFNTSSYRHHPVIHDCTTVLKEQHVPTIIPLHDDDDDDDRKPILKTTTHFPRSNRVFFESDV